MREKMIMRARECATCRYHFLSPTEFPCCACWNHSSWTDRFLGEEPLNIATNRIFSLSAVNLGIEKVIYNDPATIVFWKNGDKTVVKCQPGDTYDPQKGLALCFMKRALGNKGNYNNVFREWLPEKGEKV